MSATSGIRTGGRRAPARKWAIPAVAAAAFIAYAAMFLPYLPNAAGMSGPDYGYFLPQLLAGYFWFENNGLLSVPWFTPAFCGGVPYYPNMQGMYVSLPQYLTFAVGPVWALQLTFLAFAATGFAGFYALLRKPFGVTQWVALAGGVLFLFNGFFAYRFLIGHLTFHAFMLAPLLALSVLMPVRGTGWRRYLDVWGLIGGLILAYMVQSGMVHALPPTVLGVVVIMLVHAHLFGARPEPFLRLGVGVAVCAALSAAKLVAAVAFLQQFPRDMLPFMGFEKILHAILVTLQSLFLAPAFENGAMWTRNSEWYEDTRVILAHHEYEYGVTYLPALVMGIWLAVKARAAFRRGVRLPRMTTALWPIGSIVVLLSLPIVLNWYEPGWTAFLKELPYFRSSATMIRWVCMYIPVTVLVAALIIDRARIVPRARTTAALMIIGMAVFVNATTDRSYYDKHDKRNGYTFDRVNAAFIAVRNGAPVPAVTRIEWSHVSTYRERMRKRDRNDSLTWGASQAECYEPMFGHRLEAFPFEPMREGPTLAARDGILNVKNPACFVYPEHNDCRPGDHFAEDELEAARAFVGYRPFAFVMPWWQRAANWLSLVSLMLVGGGILWFARASIGRVRDRSRRSLRRWLKGSPSRGAGNEAAAGGR